MPLCTLHFVLYYLSVHVYCCQHKQTNNTTKIIKVFKVQASFSCMASAQMKGYLNPNKNRSACLGSSWSLILSVLMCSTIITTLSLISDINYNSFDNWHWSLSPWQVDLCEVRYTLFKGSVHVSCTDVELWVILSIILAPNGVIVFFIDSDGH